MELLADAVASNWIAPVGPHVEAFERELGEAVEMPHTLALSSGTAALHLALRLLGVGEGDEVLCSNLTFVASANAVTYLGARPVFIDSERASWNLDPELLREELEATSHRSRKPAAVVAVDLYGQCANYRVIEALCAEFEVPLVEDAAEALGAEHRGTPAGSFGSFGIFSFNGNKIITTSAGGALVSREGDAIAEARHLSAQARDPAPHYQHSKVGYNYRMSNLLAAVGRGQLRRLPERVEARRRNFDWYRELLNGVPGLAFMPEAEHGRSNRWLSCITLDPELFGADRETVRECLEEHNIESRPLWKPMHLQPLFEGCRVRGGGVAEELFERGLCLPSGSALKREEVERVADIVRSAGRAS